MKPEKQVEKEVLFVAKKLGFHLEVVDSKKTFSKRGFLGRGNAPSGMADLIGNCPNGNFAAVELKARGRLSKIRNSQKIWLQLKASMGCFVCVVDSGDMFIKCWNYWRSLPESEKIKWVSVLLKEPTKEKKRLNSISF